MSGRGPGRLIGFGGFLLGLVSATGCATSQLLVESNPPGAEVYFVGFGNSVQQLGVTPMTLSPLTVPGLYKEQVQISVSKPGYHGESFLIPPSTGATLGKISARLNTDPLSKSCQEGVAAMIDATESVAQIQRLIFKKEFTEAERLLGPLTLKYPAVPVFHSLLGNVFYLQKNLTRALESYQRASELGPQNQETLKMIERIKAIKGGGG